MSVRTLVTLAVAVFLGLITVILVRAYLGTMVQRQIDKAPTTVTVVVAAKPLAGGTILRSDMLKVVNYPAEATPGQSFRSISALTSGPDQEHVLLRAVLENEAIRTLDVSGAGGRLGLSGVVAPGMRAVSVKSSEVAGVGGFILPGDRVDILLTYTPEGGKEPSMNIIAENARVLGVDQKSSVQENTPVVTKSITVEVTPDQAAAISLAQTVGTVTLSLRHVADSAPLANKSLTVSELLNSGPRRSGHGGPHVRVIRGLETSGFSFAVGSGLKKAATATPAAIGAP